jgi:hypothetical protein
MRQLSIDMSAAMLPIRRWNAADVGSSGSGHSASAILQHLHVG